MCSSKPGCLIEILQSALHVAFASAHNAPELEGLGKVGLEPDRLVVILQRAL